MSTRAENLLSGPLTEVRNAAMLLDCEVHLHAKPRAQTRRRYGYANGFELRTPLNLVGTIELSIHQVRGSYEGLRPASLNEVMADERDLQVALAKMTIQGVASRWIKGVPEAGRASKIPAM